MSKSKHTPGPWFVGTMNDALFVISEPPRPSPVDSINTSLKTKIIAKPTEPHQEGWTVEEHKANARLIAAAPELLECCKEFVAKVDRGEARSVRSYSAMKAAIAKAEGRAK